MTMTRSSLSPADRFAIEDLITEFHWCVDNCRAAELAPLLHADVEIALPGRTLVGRDAVISFFSAALATRTATVRHSWTNLRIEQVLDEQVAFSFSQSSRRDPPEQQVHGDGDVHDVVVRKNGRWQFLRRQNQPIFQINDTGR